MVGLYDSKNLQIEYRDVKLIEQAVKELKDFIRPLTWHGQDQDLLSFFVLNFLNRYFPFRITLCNRNLHVEPDEQKDNSRQLLVWNKNMKSPYLDMDSFIRAQPDNFPQAIIKWDLNGSLNGLPIDSRTSIYTNSKELRDRFPETPLIEIKATLSLHQFITKIILAEKGRTIYFNYI